MDVEFLSGMIGELLPEHDSLALPGLGTFVAEDVPASFSDRGYTLNPPYRRINFVARNADDGLLSALYARDNDNITLSDAEAILKGFLTSLAETLRERRTVELPGIGKLRCTREGDFFFVPDDSLDVSAESCGLTPVSLRAHTAVPLPELPVMRQPAATVTPEISKADEAAPAPSVPLEPVPTAAPAPADSAPASTDVPAPAPAPAVRKRRPLLLRAFACCAAAAVLLLAAFTAVTRLWPGCADKLLYSPEELQILNYTEDGLGVSR